MATLEQALQTELPFLVTISVIDEAAFEYLMLHNSHYAIPLHINEERTLYSLMPIKQYKH